MRRLLIEESDDGMITIKPEGAITLLDVQGFIEYARTWARLLVVNRIEAEIKPFNLRRALSAEGWVEVEPDMWRAPEEARDGEATTNG